MAAISKVFVILTQYFICIYWEYMYMYLQDMKFLWAMLSLGQLYTDNETNDDDDDTNDTRWTNHDWIRSLACMSQNGPDFQVCPSLLRKGGYGPEYFLSTFQYFFGVLGQTFFICWLRYIKWNFSDRRLGKKIKITGTRFNHNLLLKKC